MKNVTITLDDELFAWARVEAAKRSKSLSKFVGETLAEKRVPELAEQMKTLNEFLEGPGWPGISHNLPKRDELYDRPVLLRHERADLRDGSDGAEEESGKR